MSWGWLLVLAAAVTWGTTGATSKLLAHDAGAGPLLVGSLRVLVASPLLLAVAAAARTRPATGRAAPVILGAGACMAAYQLLYFSAVPLAGVAATALLAICSAPLLIALLSAVLLRERVTARVLLALAVGVAGTALLVAGSGPLGSGHAFLLGAVLALGAGASYAVYVVVTKGGLAGTPALPLAALTFTVAALMLLPVLVWQRPAPATLLAGWPLFLYLGAVPTAFAYVLYTTGLKRTPATAAAMFGLVEPLTATLLGVALFHEGLGAAGLAGAALLLAALVVLSLPQPGREPVAPVQV